MAKLNPIDGDKAHHKAPTNGYIPHVDVIPMFLRFVASSHLKSSQVARGSRAFLVGKTWEHNL